MTFRNSLRDKPLHRQILRAALACLMVMSLSVAARAQSAPSSSTQGESNTEIAKQIQNPIADLISLPFQSNTNFNVGPQKGTQEVFNIQPVIPIHINDDWNVITRTVMPLTWNPAVSSNGSSSFGLGNVMASQFLSPARPGRWIWGFGPIEVLPATDPSVGSNLWGAGLSGVVLRIDGPWVYGALANNIWSFGGTSGPGGNSYNMLTVQPFLNYNFAGGWYVTSSPIITSNWEADSGNQLTLPIGGGVGRIVRLGKLPINLSLQGYYNAVAPDNAADWQLRSQLTFIF